MRRRHRFALILVLPILLLVGGDVGALPKESDRWIRVETDNFVVFSSAPKTRAVEIGKNLERLREVLTKTTSGMKVQSPLPTYIYVFKSEKAFQPYKIGEDGQPSDLAGYFVGAHDANYVAIDASAGQAPFSVIYHEYLHYFMNNNVPNLPQWLDEGFAEYYSTFRVSGLRAEIGRHIDRHIFWLAQNPMLTLEELFAIDVKSDDYHGGRRGTFYAQSWALTHYLLAGNPERREGMNRYVNSVNRGADPLESFTAAFGVDFDVVEAELRKYVKRSRYAFLVYDLDQKLEKQKVSVQSLPRVEMLYRLGQLLIHSPPVQFEAAEAHFAEALSLDESHAASYAALGRLHDLQGEYQAAVPHYRKSIELDPENASTHALYGNSVLDGFAEKIGGSAEPGGETPEQVLEARALFEKSLELDPGFVEAQAGYGKTFFFGEQDVSPGIIALSDAASAMPARVDILYDLLVLHSRSGNAEQARRILDKQLRYRAGPDLIESAERAIALVDLDEARRLLEQGNLEEGLAVMKRVADETRDPRLRAEIRAQLAAMETARQSGSVVDLYNQAVAAANDGDYEKALAILEQVIPRIEDPQMRAIAERNRTDLERITHHNRLVGQFNLAVQKANSGDLDEAIRLLEQLLRQNPDPELKRQTEAMLEQLRREG